MRGERRKKERQRKKERKKERMEEGRKAHFRLKYAYPPDTQAQETKSKVPVIFRISFKRLISLVVSYGVRTFLSTDFV